MNPTAIELAGTIIFAIAVLHTFAVKQFEHWGHHFPEGSMMRNLFHYLAEVEAVFGMWAAVFLAIYAALGGFATYGEGHVLNGGALGYLQSLNFTEPAFVFVIMCMAATKPVIELSEMAIKLVAKLIPVPGKMAFYISALIVGPLLGSFITEPAAITVTALILLNNFYKHHMSKKFKYATIGALFVNVSVGGTLTHFAAPPVLMVAGKYGWGISHMITQFGWKAAVAVVITTIIYAVYFKSELTGPMPESKGGQKGSPWWLILTHLVFIGGVVYTAHYLSFFMALFVFFLGLCKVTEQYQESLKLRESLMVGFFLGGLVTLGGVQAWWLKEILAKMSDLVLYFGATGLTAITDNAALTYLGSLVDLSDSAKYNLVAGAVSGGGLTVIANAPNPAGYGILKESFGEEGITPMGLLLGALFPTFIVILCFQLLPSL